MKSLIALLLCLSLTTTQLNATTYTFFPEDLAKPHQNSVWLLVAIVLSAGIVGTVCILKARATLPDYTGPVTLVLEKSYDNHTWTPVATNTVTLNGLTPIDAFQTDMTDSSALYRAHIQR